MFVKGLLIETRPKVFRDFHNSFGSPMFSVNFVLKNSIFFCLTSFWVLYLFLKYFSLVFIPSAISLSNHSCVLFLF